MIWRKISFHYLESNPGKAYILRHKESLKNLEIINGAKGREVQRKIPDVFRELRISELVYSKISNGYADIHKGYLKHVTVDNTENFHMNS